MFSRKSGEDEKATLDTFSKIAIKKLLPKAEVSLVLSEPSKLNRAELST